MAKRTLLRVIMGIITACVGIWPMHPLLARAQVSPLSILPRPATVLTVGDNTPAVLYLHEMLAGLGYLPLTFQSVFPADALYGTRVDSPSVGMFHWRFSNVPSTLVSEWDPNRYNMLTKGAVMTFELEHGMPVDGFAGPRVFLALDVAWRLQLHSRHSYTYVMVRQAVPQTISIWKEGRWVFSVPCSTGTAKAPTHVGTHVVYLRTREQTMDGVGPSGRPYRVEHVPYVSFFYQGEAIHGLYRPSYGTPQSVGCVETSIAHAKVIWTLTDYGTLVYIGQLDPSITPSR